MRSATPTKKKAPKPAPAPADAQARGVIDVNKIYTLAAFRRRVGAGDWAMRQMRRDGLRVTQIGNLRFVTGADFAAFVAAAAEREGGKSSL
jgi:hypothetical protein